MTLTKTIVMFSILACFTACGSKKGGSDTPASNETSSSESETSTDPKPKQSQEMRELGVPAVNPNRPKTGKASVLNTPWLLKAAAMDQAGYFLRPYFYFSENSLKSTFLCGMIIDGKRQWVKPSAKSPIQWNGGSFDVLERNEGAAVIGEIECTTTTIPANYAYQVLDNGERLVLTVEGEILELTPFRSLDQVSTTRSIETDVHTPMFKAQINR